MPIDRYTKAVLTIIAGALLYIAAMLSGQPASAQSLAPAAQAFVEPGRAAAGRRSSAGARCAPTARCSSTPSGTSAASPGPTPRLPVALQATRQQPLPVSIQQPGGQPLPVSLGVTTQRPLPVAITSIKPGGTDWEQIRVKVDPQAPTPRPGFP